MSTPKSENLSRRNFLGVSVGAVVVAGIGCGSNDKSGANSSAQTGGAGPGGASNATGGATGNNVATGGGSSQVGGSGSTIGGASSAGSGTNVSGGNSTATGGVGAGGSSPTGGSATTGGLGAGGSSGGTSATGGTQANSSSTKSTKAATGGTTGATTKASGGTSVTGGTSASGGTTGGTTTGSTGQKPLVCLSRNTDVNKAVKDAIAAVGGFPDLMGKTVVIRPNCIPTDGPPYNTNPDVIKAIIQAVKAASSGAPKSITVCDDAYSNPGGLVQMMQTNGIAKAATDEGATAVDMYNSGTTTVNPTGATQWTSGITFYNMMLDADYVINAPVCKSHSYAGFTMAMKGWYGNQTNYRNTHPTNLSSALAELHLAKKEDIVVIDATKTLLNGGPFKASGDVVASSGIVVASTDAIAADVTGLCIMKYYIKQMNATNSQITNQTVWKQGVIARAQQLTQLGWITGKTFPYQGIGVDEVDTIMAALSA